jgi:DNA repair exonuclease SbcCD nuclease subunit
MKILHTADWHIGLTIDNIDLTETFYSKVNEIEFNCLKKIIELEQSF